MAMAIITHTAVLYGLYERVISQYLKWLNLSFNESLKPYRTEDKQA